LSGGDCPSRDHPSMAESPAGVIAGLRLEAAVAGRRGRRSLR
jgi:hypothetical protein